MHTVTTNDTKADKKAGIKSAVIFLQDSLTGTCNTTLYGSIHFY